MSLYQTVKSAITVRQVGEMYGMGPDRHGMVCCPFHSDNHPSMMLNDTYYYCFGCGANGDAIDLTAKLFDLNPRQAAEKLMHDFAFAKQCSPQWGLQVTERSCVSKMEGPRPDKLWLDPDKPPANAISQVYLADTLIFSRNALLFLLKKYGIVSVRCFDLCSLNNLKGFYHFFVTINFSEIV